MRQTYRGPVRWIVVDDGEKAQPVTFAREGWTMEVIRRQPFWEHGQNTQCRNFEAALAVTPADAAVVVIEDDDWYAPEWLDVAADALSDFDLVGQSRNRYVNARTGHMKQHENLHHSSLCSTAFKGAALAEFRRVVAQAPKLCDMMLWRGFTGSRHLVAGNYVIGIKAMPGRSGIASGHELTYKANGDPAMWMGEDARAYAQFR